MHTGPAIPFSPNARLPDPRIEVLDARFAALRLFSSSVEQLATGFHWAEGPVWFGDGRFLLFSDIPNDRILRWDDCSGALAEFRRPSNHANGLAFSPDERVLYVVESRATPHRKIWAWDVDGATLRNKHLLIDAGGPGAFDGIAVDEQGNLWCGLGSNGAADADPEALDGVRVYAPDGTAIGHIHLPERCANLCFGGPKRNRLFMASSHSLYALHVGVRGAP